MIYGDMSANDWSSIANLFGQHFATAYTASSPNCIDHFNINNDCIPRIRNILSNITPININEETVLEYISKLPNNMISGPDGIPNIFIKKCASPLLTPITQLLIVALETHTVPSIWRQSYVRPVYKSGGRNNIENYRGVALQCVISKLLDSIVTHHINEFIVDIVDKSQHGFLKGRSTITNLMEFTSQALVNMEKGVQTDAIYIDIAKAFDTVNIHLLIHKLNIMGLNSNLLLWIKSYLTDRKQIVKINNAKSQPIKVTSGTGQGYPIGATLFILFMLDLPFVIKNSNIHSFADDTKLWKPILNQNDCNTLQNDLYRIAEYFKRNQLRLNINKTKMISYHRGQLKFDNSYYIDDTKITRVFFMKDLGVILDQRLNFKSHVSFIVAKAKSRLAWVKRFAYEFRDPWTIKRIYSTFVLPIIEYGSQIWNPYYDDGDGRVESIQKQFLLYALRHMKWPHRHVRPKYEHRLLLLQMITLSERRKVAQVVFLLNILHGSITSTFIRDHIRFTNTPYSTRAQNSLEIPIRTRNYSQREPINSMLYTFNEFMNKKIPNCDIMMIDLNLSTDTVKKRMSEYFISSRSLKC